MVTDRYIDFLLQWSIYYVILVRCLFRESGIFFDVDTLCDRGCCRDNWLYLFLFPDCMSLSRKIVWGCNQSQFGWNLTFCVWFMDICMHPINLFSRLWWFYKDTVKMFSHDTIWFSFLMSSWKDKLVIVFYSLVKLGELFSQLSLLVGWKCFSIIFCIIMLWSNLRIVSRGWSSHHPNQCKRRLLHVERHWLQMNF